MIGMEVDADDNASIDDCDDNEYFILWYSC
jgi:hypothetical protein